jgi:hypothetical protein
VDGLGQAVGSGISGLVAGAIGGISAAIGGMADALNDALPPGALPVIGVGLLLLFVWAVIRR